MPDMMLVKGRHGYLGSIILYKLFYYFFQSCILTLRSLSYKQVTVSSSYQTGETKVDISVTRLRSTKFRHPSSLVVLLSGLAATLCPHWCVPSSI